MMTKTFSNVIKRCFLFSNGFRYMVMVDRYSNGFRYNGYFMKIFKTKLILFFYSFVENNRVKCEF